MKRAPKIKRSGVPTADVSNVAGATTSPVTLTKLAKYGALLLAIVMLATFWKKSTVGVKDLTTADADTLKEAFFGKTPYLFYCGKHAKDEKLPEPFRDAHASKAMTMGFAKVNCSQVLPSGKTIYERFKLKKIVRPTIFATAPWMKPQQVAMNHLKDYGTLIKYIETVMAPKPTVVNADKDLHKFCGFDKNTTTDVRSIGDTCVVVLRGTRYGKVHTDLEKRLVLEYPQVRFAALDATKKRLSFEETTEFVAADNFALKLHALRNGTHYITMVNPATWDYLTTFVGQAVGTPLYGYTGDGNVRTHLVKARSDGTIDNTASKTKKFKKRGPPPAAYTSSQSSTASEKVTEEPKTDPAAQEAERVRKERARREAMERAAAEHHMHGDDGDAGKDEEDAEEGNSVEDNEDAGEEDADWGDAEESVIEL
jgi:hypothetical protein